jgi:hypothetical protein
MRRIVLSGIVAGVVALAVVSALGAARAQSQAATVQGAAACACNATVCCCATTTRMQCNDGWAK